MTSSTAIKDCNGSVPACLSKQVSVSKGIATRVPTQNPNGCQTQRSCPLLSDNTGNSFNKKRARLDAFLGHIRLSFLNLSEKSVN